VHDYNMTHTVFQMI